MEETILKTKEDPETKDVEECLEESLKDFEFKQNDKGYDENVQDLVGTVSSKDLMSVSKITERTPKTDYQTDEAVSKELLNKTHDIADDSTQNILMEDSILKIKKEADIEVVEEHLEASLKELDFKQNDKGNDENVHDLLLSDQNKSGKNKGDLSSSTAEGKELITLNVKTTESIADEITVTTEFAVNVQPNVTCEKSI